jgi:hypothetical protein
MIGNDQELQTTQERIAYFQDLLAQMRVRATREELPLMAGSYRAEIEKMQKEVLDYGIFESKRFPNVKARQPGP